MSKKDKVIEANKGEFLNNKKRDLFIETGLTAEQTCHLYACIAWNGMNYEDAKKLVQGKTNEELENITYANSSIQTAKAGIEKYKNELNSNLKYKAVIKILEEIHDKWVVDNAKKFDREGKEFQHMPTALIGVQEVAKDMMFLQPFLYEMDIDIGHMKKEAYGAFEPTYDVEKTYKIYVDRFMSKEGINELTPAVIANVIENYDALKGNTEIDKKRIEHLEQNAESLVKQVEEKNPIIPELIEEDELEIDFSQLSDEDLKKYVRFKFNEEKSFLNHTIMGSLVPQAGEIKNIIGAAQEFMARHPDMECIDLKGLQGQIDLHLTQETTAKGLLSDFKMTREKMYEEHLARKKESTLENNI